MKKLNKVVPALMSVLSLALVHGFYGLTWIKW